MREMNKEPLISVIMGVYNDQRFLKEAIESILSAMKIGMEMAKQKNKEKYTPKKYKKD